MVMGLYPHLSLFAIVFFVSHLPLTLCLSLTMTIDSQKVAWSSFLMKLADITVVWVSPLLFPLWSRQPWVLPCPHEYLAQEVREALFFLSFLVPSLMIWTHCIKPPGTYITWFVTIYFLTTHVFKWPIDIPLMVEIMRQPQRSQDPRDVPMHCATPCSWGSLSRTES